MTHSGATAVDNTFDEYADTSCYMGYSVDDGQNDQYDEQKCFNAAKMVEQDGIVAPIYIPSSLATMKNSMETLLE